MNWQFVAGTCSRCELGTGNCELVTTNCELVTTNCELVTTCCAYERGSERVGGQGPPGGGGHARFHQRKADAMPQGPPTAMSRADQVWSQMPMLRLRAMMLRAK